MMECLKCGKESKLACYNSAGLCGFCIDERSDRCMALQRADWRRRLLYLLGHVDDAPGCVSLMLPAYRKSACL